MLCMRRLGSGRPVAINILIPYTDSMVMIVGGQRSGMSMCAVAAIQDDCRHFYKNLTKLQCATEIKIRYPDFVDLKGYKRA